MKKNLGVLVFLLLITGSAFAQQSPYTFDETLLAKKGRLADIRRVNPVLSGQRHKITEEARWNDKFTIPGIIGAVYTTGSDGENFYVGGNFKTAGGVVANCIVKWDGQKWSSLGEGPENGVNGNVHAIAYTDGKLFVGGMFNKAGTVDVNGMAYWDGSSWNRVGNDEVNGVRQTFNYPDTTITGFGYVYALFAHNNKLYAGGDFDLAGDSMAVGVAAWDITTETWNPMNGGLASIYEHDPVYAYAFAAREDTVYVGGKFFSAGGVEARHIAKWDGKNWEAMGTSDGYIYDLQMDSQHNLYAHGFFLSNGEHNESGIAKFDGKEWISIPAPENYSSGVNVIKVFDDVLYVSGAFNHKTGEMASAGFAKWDGDNWELIYGLGQTHNEFFIGSATGIELVNGRLYLAGDFTIAGELYVRNVVEWDLEHAQWKIMDDGSAIQGILDGYISVIESAEDGIIAAGTFRVAGGVFARNIAKWTGSKWESLGTSYNNGVRGYINDVLVDGKDIYVGGYFGSAGTVEAYHIAKWDGESWSSIGIGVGGLPGSYVNALAKVDNYLYAGGYFSVVGDAENYELPANSIARFNLETERWESIGNGVEYNHGVPGIVHDLEVHDGIIYVGGWYNLGDGQDFENIAALVENKWRGIEDVEASGIEGIVYKVKVINDEIYVGGTLQPEKGGELQGVMKWEKGWTTVGERLASEDEYIYVSDIEPYAEGFLAGGYFEMAGGIVVNNLAYFDGNAWSMFAGGVQPYVASILTGEHSVFVSGPEAMINDAMLSIGLAEYIFEDTTTTPPPVSTEKDHEIPSVFKLEQNYPNPFNPLTNINYSVPARAHVSLRVFDALGRLVATLVDEEKAPGSYHIGFDGSQLSSGVYFYRMQSGSFLETKKFLLLK